MTTLADLFLHDVPLLDVRAGQEFAQGAFPNATNLPILNDAERHEVGLCYKQRGPAAAEQLGHELVSGQTRNNRIEQWINWQKENPQGWLYCFRGGKRSQIACEWLRLEGHPLPRVQGGYKSLRRCLLDLFDALPPFLIISGHTGVGKTDLVNRICGGIDLEGLANHRGSAFGKRVGGQPAQIDFENRVAISLLKLTQTDQRHAVLEDEGRLIGRIQVPPLLREAMQQSPIVVVDEALESRVERILRDYILVQYEELEAVDSHGALRALSEQLLAATDAIRKRLGGVAHAEVRALVSQAIEAQRRGDTSRHRDWIRILLTQYYDPMYAYQLTNKQDRVLFRGNSEDVTAFCEAYSVQ